MAFIIVYCLLFGVDLQFRLQIYLFTDFPHLDQLNILHKIVKN